MWTWLVRFWRSLMREFSVSARKPVFCRYTQIISFGVVSGPRLNKQAGLPRGQPDGAVSLPRTSSLRPVADAVLIS